MAVPAAADLSFPCKSVRLTRVKPRGGAVVLACPTAGQMYIFGGADREGLLFGDLFAFDYHAGKMQTLFDGRSGDPHAAPAAGGAAGVLARFDDTGTPPGAYTHLLTVGGIDFVNGRVFDSLHAFDLVAKAWVAITLVEGSDAPPARTGHTLTAIPADAVPGHAHPATAACALLFGGSSPEEGPMNDVYLLAVWRGEEGALTARWTQLATHGPAAPPRELHAALLLPIDTSHASARVLIMGGRDGDAALRDAACLTLSTLTWEPAVRMPAACASAAVGMHDGVVYVVGGWSGDATLASDVGVFDTRTQEWRRGKLQSTSAMSPRFACAGDIVLVPKEQPLAFDPSPGSADRVVMLMFGGMSVEADLNECTHVLLAMR